MCKPSGLIGQAISRYRDRRLFPEVLYVAGRRSVAKGELAHAMPPLAGSLAVGIVLDCYPMDDSSFETLELPKVLERLASLAAFSASKELARALKPTAVLELAKRRQTQTMEAIEIRSVSRGLSVGGARDVRPQAQAAARGSVLEPTDILDVKSTLLSARSLRKTLDRLRAEFPELSAIASSLEPLPDVVEAISKALDERGEVVDGASALLASIRRDLWQARERLTTKLQRLIGNPKIVAMLQEPIITQRDGRFVVPLRAEFKGQLKAVVHDQSTSGATLFVEPLQVVELNNQTRELELAEQDEVRRILAELSHKIGQEAEEIARTVEGLAQLDLAFAKARLAEQMEAASPTFEPFKPQGHPSHPGSSLKLLSARHPLLEPEKVVPIDVTLDDETYGLVITGPNTGGKTVALKTVGLLALMAQCGLHIPALPGSAISVFRGVYADIGDEQSIEQSLSTFSAHIANIIRVLERADNQSLVLLDELGAGTDPQEGAALARAILDTLIERSVTTLVATHYPELKTHAHATSGVRNANVEFDLESLRPTYRLRIGLPGRSNALAIAERLGLDSGVVRRARGMLTQEELSAEGLLDEIHRQREAAEQALSEIEQVRASVQTEREELAQRLEAIDEERRAILIEGRQRAEEELAQVREEIRRLRSKLQAAAQPLEALKPIEQQVEQLEEKAAKPEPRLTPRATPGRPPKLGDRVVLPSLKAEGVITEVGIEQAEVQIGRLRVRADLDELKIVGAEDPAAEKPAARRRGRRGKGEPSEPKAPPLELHLRGMAADEALEELERRLDAAFLAGVPFIRVVHGKGTGRLRQAVREFLEGNPYTASFEPGTATEGGEGVTIVRLAI
ncbi:MAG: endonuclease MutS2 [Anaerolineales bacterium]